MCRWDSHGVSLPRHLSSSLVPLLLVIVTVLVGCVTPSPVRTLTPEPTATPQATVTPPSFIIDLNVSPDERYQTVKDVVGGNFVHRFGGVREPLDPVSTFTMETLGPRYARVSMTLEDWEPINDDGDPLTFNWDGFQEANFIPATMGFLRIMQERGGAIVASTWDLPDWMVVDPTVDSPREPDPELYPEVVETIAAWLLHAQEAYGVTVDYVSFNEATLGINIVLTPDQYAALIGLAGPRFEALGLTTKWLLGDCHNISSCAGYASDIYAHEEIRPYLGPLAFHSWDATVLDAALVDIADLAEANGLEVWCTEGGWNAQLWQTPDRFPTWTNALSLGTIYSRVLKLSHATVIDYWQMMGGDYAINDGEVGFPVWHVLNQYAQQFPEGTEIVGTSPDRNGIFILAGRAPEHFVVQVINKNMVDFHAVISGLPAGTYTLISSTADAVDSVADVYEVTGGTLALDLPRASINILTTLPVPAP